jgi:alkaline phosphatase D
MTVTRRRFLQGAAPLTLAPFLPGCEGAHPSPDDVFAHGVASGDPLPDAVILWTRVSAPAVAHGPIAVTYRVARDPELAELVLEGQLSTGPELDYTLKVDATGLEPGVVYYYQFAAFGRRSVVGRTRTLPNGHVEALRVAVASCSNYPYGYFNAYRLIAERDDLDLVMHLGDYLYEYANGDYGDGAPLDRIPDPEHEIVTLEDYRRRHAQYKSDPDLQAAHRQHAFITVWDDHESANDAFKDGAQNHQPESEGDWALRKAAAIQAYHEWMPIRELTPDNFERIYRSFEVGDLADLILLDTRLIGRDAQVADPCDFASLADPSRTLLGPEQQAWLFDGLQASQARGARWRLLGQQVMFGQLLNVLAQPVCVFNTDQWDGYAASRAAVLDLLERRAIDNVVILTGDIHSSWALDVTTDPFDPAVYDPASGRGSRAVELIAPAVTSPGIDDPAQAAAFAAALTATHPHLKFVELYRRGYLSLEITHERVRAEWHHVRTISEPSSEEDIAATLEVRAGDNHLTPQVADEAPEGEPLLPGVTATAG